MAGDTWVFGPSLRSAAIWRSLTSVRIVPADGALEGEDVFPGVRHRLGDVLG